MDRDLQYAVAQLTDDERVNLPRPIAQYIYKRRLERSWEQTMEFQWFIARNGDRPILQQRWFRVNEARDGYEYDWRCIEVVIGE